MRRALGLLLLLVLTSCGNLLPPTSTPTPAPSVETETPLAPQTATPPVVQSLRIWLPPQFDPNDDTPAASLLKARLDAFTEAHPVLALDIRIKGTDENQSLLEALSLTRSAAPEALPDLIALPRADLEAAALKGLVHPLEGLTDLLTDPNWYPYARPLGQVQSTAYGLPFAGDALAVAYHPDQFEQIPITWTDLFAKRRTLAVASSDPNGYLQLSLYLSTGSPLLDETNHVMLDEAALTRVFQQLDAGSLIAFQSEQDAWAAFVDGRVDLALTWTSRFIREPQPDSVLLPLPGLEGTPFTLATGWTWALAGSHPQSDSLAAELAEWLVADEFLSDWDQALGYLPPRPNAMVNLDPRGTLDSVSQSAQVLPSNDILFTLGPILQDSLGRLLNGEQAETVAQSAVETLK